MNRIAGKFISWWNIHNNLCLIVFVFILCYVLSVRQLNLVCANECDCNDISYCYLSFIKCWTTSEYRRKVHGTPNNHCFKTECYKRHELTYTSCCSDFPPFERKHTTYAVHLKKMCEQVNMQWCECVWREEPKNIRRFRPRAHRQVMLANSLKHEIVPLLKDYIYIVLSTVINSVNTTERIVCISFEFAYLYVSLTRLHSRTFAAHSYSSRNDADIKLWILEYFCGCTYIGECKIMVADFVLDAHQHYSTKHLNLWNNRRFRSKAFSYSIEFFEQKEFGAMLLHLH